MQKIEKIAALIVCIFAFSMVPLRAHPGRTDASGGHHDRSTGSYHYHHGYPAHQHTDLDGDGISDCPYNFSSNTAASTDSSASKTQPADTSTVSSAAAVRSANNQDDSSSKLSWVEWVLIVIITLPFTIPILNLLFFAIKQIYLKLYHLTPQYKEYIREQASLKATELKKDLLSLNQRYSDLYNQYQKIRSKDIKACIAIPDGFIIDPYGLPRSQASVLGTPDPICEFYISPNGTLHRSTCRYAKPPFVNALDLKFYKKKCSVCSPVIPQLSWARKYRIMQNRIQTLDSFFDCSNRNP